MLKIGEFSRICQVSVKALRHWDAIGLLKPDVTDPLTGYRYYTIQQVGAVNRISAFKTMGLPLDRIAELLHENLSTADIRAMLLLKQGELRQQIDEAAHMLTLVEARLRQIEHQGSLPDYEVALKSIEPQPILGIRETVSTLDALVALLAETYPYARQKENANLLAVFHDEGFEVECVDVEVGFPVDSMAAKALSLSAARQMTVRTLPEVELMASTVHHGEWLALSQAYVHLGHWIEAHGYSIAGPGREVFHYIDWENDQRATVTELQFPIVR
ncbi:MAG: MerR family transcriptional regulator [Anaerolineae bacterium]|nr:MerR family transcriptional regulator [Anaerolineae bacterium]